MLLCYFVKIEMFLAAEIIIIYQHFFQEAALFLLPQLEELYCSLSVQVIKSNASVIAHDYSRNPIYDRTRIVLEYFKHLI